MSTIWKYPLTVCGEQSVRMPGGAEILTAQFQGDELCLWVLVDSDAPTKERVIEIFGTGNPVQPVNARRTFIATAQDLTRHLVWHVFERI